MLSTLTFVFNTLPEELSHIDAQEHDVPEGHPILSETYCYSVQRDCVDLTAHEDEEISLRMYQIVSAHNVLRDVIQKHGKYLADSMHCIQIVLSHEMMRVFYCSVEFRNV